MGHRRQGESHFAPQQRAALARDGKKNETPLLTGIEQLCAEVVPAKHAARLANHLLAQLACLGTHTVTGLLNTCGRQFQDWTADYRLYSRDRIRSEDLFEPVRRVLCEQQGPVVTALDDTRLKKSGRKVYGAKYTRDPMGPPFHVNFIRAQRFLQTSMAYKGPDGQARMIPVDWRHAPIPQKPGPKAAKEQWDAYHVQRKAARISEVGVQRIAHMRAWLDQHEAHDRTLWSVADGSFTNGTVLKQLPPNTTFVGRIRADAKLYHLPDAQPERQGRRRAYGRQAPTPEQLREDPNLPWKNVAVFLGGQQRTLRVKQLTPLRWRTAGQAHNLQLLVIAPTAYRLSRNSKLLYRKPAYLICTNPDAPIEEIVQHYLWRWDIEVNFRDEKTLLGVGEAQVRTPAAVQNVTACAVAAYAMLLTAACQDTGQKADHLPPPKWNQRRSERPTTSNLIKNLRYEMWARAIHFSGFLVHNKADTKPQKTVPDPKSAIFYAQRFS